MKTLLVRTFGCAMLVLAIIFDSHADPKIIIQETGNHELSIVVDATVHETYGLSYPMTYKVSIPAGSSGLSAFRRHGSSEAWFLLPEKSEGEFFNGIEVVRFDYAASFAYVSAGFGHTGDSLFIRVMQAGANVDIGFEEICTYYDNRDAAVTLTADDWHPSFDPYFHTALDIFRSYNLYVSGAIVTEWCDGPTWASIQSYLDSGDVEAVAHGRNHLHSPYTDPEYEVGGAKEDIINFLDLPAHSRYGDREYVPVWVAPYGEYDAAIEYAVSLNHFIVSRVVNWNYNFFSQWNTAINMYDPIGVVHEMGPLWGGITDTVQLNADFDITLAENGVYHLMCHPHVLADQWDEAYPWAHLRHISNRTNLWYTNLGHLYMYHLLQDPSSSPSTSVVATDQIPEGFRLYQNYPNPFNPSTTIEFSVPQTGDVTLTVYDIAGREINTLISGNLFAGSYKTVWTPGTIASGVYIYRLRAGSHVLTRSMVLLK